MVLPNDNLRFDDEFLFNKPPVHDSKPHVNLSFDDLLFEISENSDADVSESLGSAARLLELVADAIDVITACGADWGFDYEQRVAMSQDYLREIMPIIRFTTSRTQTVEQQVIDSLSDAQTIDQLEAATKVLRTVASAALDLGLTLRLRNR